MAGEKGTFGAVKRAVNWESLYVATPGVGGMYPAFPGTITTIVIPEG